MWLYILILENQEVGQILTYDNGWGVVSWGQTFQGALISYLSFSLSSQDTLTINPPETTNNESDDSTQTIIVIVVVTVVSIILIVIAAIVLYFVSLCSWSYW